MRNEKNTNNVHGGVNGIAMPENLQIIATAYGS